MNRISPLLEKLSELYLSKVRTEHLQESTLQIGDIDAVMRQTRAAYSELLEWQRTMSEIESLLLQESGSQDSGFGQTLPAPPPPPARAARPAAPAPKAPAPAPAPKPEPAAARPTFTPIAPPPAPELEPEPEPMPQYAEDDSFFTSEAAEPEEADLEEEPVAPPPPPRPAPRPAPVQEAAAPMPIPTPRPKAAPAPGSVSDIRELVSVNDKYLFVSELFNHNRTAYEKAMEAINKFRSRIQATNWVNALVKKEYKWDDDSTTAKAFYKVINQYFAAK